MSTSWNGACQGILEVAWRWARDGPPRPLRLGHRAPQQRVPTTAVTPHGPSAKLPPRIERQWSLKCPSRGENQDLASFARFCRDIPRGPAFAFCAALLFG